LNSGIKIYGRKCDKNPKGNGPGGSEKTLTDKSGPRKIGVRKAGGEFSVAGCPKGGKKTARRGRGTLCPIEKLKTKPEVNGKSRDFGPKRRDNY